MGDEPQKAANKGPRPLLYLYTIRENIQNQNAFNPLHTVLPAPALVPKACRYVHTVL